MSWGQEQCSVLGDKPAGDRQQASFTYKVVEEHHLLFKDSTLKMYFKRCPGKCKAGPCGWNPKLKFLSKLPDSGCEQSCHTVKCLGSNSKQLPHHKK